MVILAYIELNPVARDVLLSAGLLLAAVLLAVLMGFQMRLPASMGRKILLSVFSMVGVVAILWSVSDPISRLAQRRRILRTTEAVMQLCLSASDSDLRTFGIRPDSETWEVVPPDGYQRLFTKAKSEGRIENVRLSADNQVVDAWGRPFRIAILQTGGKRSVAASSLGADGVAGTVDDIASAASMEFTKP